EEDRTWIARELHDDVNQRIALLAVNLERLGQALNASNGQRSHLIKEVQEQVSDLGIDIQALSHRLHSSKLEYLGLAAACEGFCREFSEQQSVQIDFHSQDIPKNCLKKLHSVSSGSCRKPSRMLPSTVGFGSSKCCSRLHPMRSS